MLENIGHGKGILFLFLSIIIVLFLQGCDPIVGENYRLMVEIEGEGIVQVSPESSVYIPGTEVELKAVSPAEGKWKFSHWSGDVSGEKREIKLVMEKDAVVVAHFKLINGASLEGTIKIQHSWPYSPNFSGKQVSSSSFGDISPLNNEYKMNELIIQMMPSPSQVMKNLLERELDGKIKGEIKEIGAILVEVWGDFYAKMIVAENIPGVINVQPNYLYQTHGKIPNDPHFSHQWHYPLIRLPQAWEKTTGNPNINIAVLDTGVDWNHPDLDEVVQGYNFINGNDNPMDYHGHGTHVAGTIRASTDNNLGVSGVMWSGKIVPVKVLDDYGSGNTWGVAQGILYAAGLLENPQNPYPAQVINMSLGGSSPGDQTLESAVKKAKENGTILVASAGNNNKEELGYPAALDDVISVGSVTYNSSNPPVKASYSNYGEDLDIVAPGGDHGSGVLSTYFSFNGNSKTYNYSYMVGTSMAAPHVSGVIGLMLAAGIPEGEIRGIIQKTAMDLGEEGFDSFYGFGMINANWAINNVETIKIIVGEREGNVINSRAEVSISLEDRFFEIPEVVPGHHRVYAWIDIGNNGILEPGDYLAESQLIFFGSNQEVSVDLILRGY